MVSNEAVIRNGDEKLTGKTNPDLKNLLEKVILCSACKKIEEKKYANGQLNESDVHTRFHVYSEGRKTDFMFIMEKPGWGKDGVYKDQVFLDNGRLLGFPEYVDQRQKAFIKWIKKQNKLFDSGEFFDTVSKILKRPIDDKNLFEHFHVSDVQKCIDGNPKICFNKFLKEEIKFLEPDLIFCFGRKAWDQIKACDDFRVKPISADHGESTKIKDLHGRLFKFKIENKKGKDKIVWIMPCLHFSVRTRNSAPRTTYMDYIKDGIKDYKNKKG